MKSRNYLIHCKDLFDIEIKFLFDYRSGNHRRYISWENWKLFIKKQDDIHDDPFGMDDYGKKEEDLIRKYASFNEHSKEKGSIFSFLLKFLEILFHRNVG